MFKKSFYVILTVFSLLAFAEDKKTDFDGSYVDLLEAHRYHKPPAGRDNPPRRHEPPHNDIEKLISYQTPIKSQGHRGTCSIFSATALLESMLLITGKVIGAPLILSEEWLEYKVNRHKKSDGSTSALNFKELLDHGSARLSLMKYIGETWDIASLETSADAKKYCGKIEKKQLDSCLLVHRDPGLFEADANDLQKNDPDFLAARNDAEAFKSTYLHHSEDEAFPVYNEDDIKGYLDKGIPLTLDLDFYYGAWNHRLAADEPGLSDIGRNMDHWGKGIVGYPEVGSLDRKLSPHKPAGHSIVVVGYDDDVEVKTKVKMDKKDAHGNWLEKEFTYKGVYYFKNSWGKGNFGANLVVGEITHDGYGMITQEYAHELGEFFALKLKQ